MFIGDYSFYKVILDSPSCWYGLYKQDCDVWYYKIDVTKTVMNDGSCQRNKYVIEKNIKEKKHSKLLRQFLI